MDTDALFLQADDAYEQENFALAFSLFLAAADKGNCYAMTRIAAMYDSGEGTLLDVSKSIEWDLKAVAAGSRTSILNLGIAYKKLGDIAKARDWFENALAQGDGEAGLELAKLHYSAGSAASVVRSYLEVAASSSDLSESGRAEVQEWLLKNEE
jgi:uncharacterized protein